MNTENVRRKKSCKKIQRIERIIVGAGGLVSTSEILLYSQPSWYQFKTQLLALTSMQTEYTYNLHFKPHTSPHIMET
jgi:hypothetical protein